MEALQANGENLDIVVERLLEMMIYTTGFCTKTNFKVGICGCLFSFAKLGH